MPSYLVTGGAGFIGSHIAEELLRRGARVRVADSFITGKRENLAHLTGVELVEGDLADLSVARRAVEGMDYVLHQAAIPSVPRSVKDPIESNRANVVAALNVLVAARDAGVKRVVYAGSSSAYGNTPTLPKREDMTPNPLSPYALQKLVAEQVPASCSRRCTASKPSRSAISTCSDRGRIRARRTRASSRFSRPRSSRIASRPSTATAGRRATSPTSPTSSTASCARRGARAWPAK